MYPDEIDLGSGKIKYWGDAKRKSPKHEISVDDFTGNGGLKPQYDQIRQGKRETVAPILVFEKEQTGSVRFCGLCVLDAVTEDKYPQEFESKTVWTPNYLYRLVVLDVEEVPIEWIHDRALRGSDSRAPAEWLRWKATGEVPGDQRYQATEVDDDGPADDSTRGRESRYTTSKVSVSKQFHDRVFELYDEECAMTEIRGSPLVTVAHVVPRSEAIEYAEDITNVLLLNWTHHMAFDAGLFTFDKDLRIRVAPHFNPDDPHLQSTIVDREGQTLELPVGAEISKDRLRERNQSLDWM